MNAENIVQNGPEKALTGPVERNDVQTVRHHLESLGKDLTKREVYRLLSLELTKIAQEKHWQRNYTQMKEVLK